MCATADNNQTKVSNYCMPLSNCPLAFYANNVWFDCMLNKQRVFGNKLRQLNGSKERDRSSRLVSRDQQREGARSRRDEGRERLEESSKEKTKRRIDGDNRNVGWGGHKRQKREVGKRLGRC